MARLSLFVLLASTATLALAQAPPPSSTLQPVLTPSPSAAVPPATGSPQVPPPVASQTPGAGPPGSPSLPAPAPGQQAPVVPGAPGAAPGGHGPPGGKESHSPFMYQPSFSIAVGAAIIFIISTTITTVQLFSYKTWYFALILQAAVVDVVASVARCHAVLNPKSMGAYIIQMMGYQIAPSMLGISIFFTFTRVIWWVTPNDKRSRRVLWFPIHKISFCWTLLFALPDIGKGIAGNIGKPAEGKMPNPASIGSRIQQICLAVGFFVAALWTLWAIRFMRMSRKWIINGEAEDKDWRKLGWACVGSGVLLTWRLLYGVVEFDAQYNPKAFISIHEWMYWTFDAIPVLLIYTIFNFQHPGDFLPMSYTRFKFNTKAIEKDKMDSAWPLTISNPIPRPDGKAFEVTTTEIHPHPGSRV